MLAPIRFEFGAGLSEHLPQVGKLFLESPVDTSAVIQACQVGFLRSFRTSFISCLNAAGAFLRSKGTTLICHSPWPVKKAFSFRRRGAGPLLSRHLQVQDRKTLGFGKHVQGVVDPRDREAVLAYVIQLPVVHSETEVLFVGTTTMGDDQGMSGLLNYSPFLYGLQLLIHLSLLDQREPARGSPFRTGASGVDTMVTDCSPPPYTSLFVANVSW